MKRILLLTMVILSVAFLASTFMSVWYLSGMDHYWSAQPGVLGAEGRAVSVVLPSGNEIFWDDLATALQKWGKNFRIVYDVKRYNPSGANVLEIVEQASYSQVGAMVCLPPDSFDATAVVNHAEERGLPVLLLENDLPASRRQVFLGAGSFQMGLAVGRLIIEMGFPGHRGGILLSQTNLERQTVRNSLFLNGLNEVLTKTSGEIGLTEVISPPGRFAGEELVWGLLRDGNSMGFLVTTNSKDTSSALQTIVEANRVGRTWLVGVGEDPSLKEALSQGLIEGLIVRDSEEWAKIITATVNDLFNGGTVNSYVNLPIHSWTKTGEVLGR